MTDKPTTLMKRRLNLWINLLIIILIIYIVFSIFKTSVTESDKWRELADSQQLKSTVVQASRGTIYDSTDQVLAQSATMYTVYCDQVMLWDDYVSKKDEKIEEYKQLIKDTNDAEKVIGYEESLAKLKTSQQCFDDLVAFLAQTLEMDSEDIRKKIGDENSQYVILKKDIEKTAERF